MPAGVIAGRQRRVSLEVELRTIEIRLGGPQARRRLIDHRLLQLEPSGVGRDAGYRGGESGLGLGELGGEIAVVDDEQNLAGRHRFVVADPDFLDVPLDLWADQRHVALDVGVVGRLQEAPVGPPIPTAADAEDEQGRDRDNQQGFTHGCVTRLNGLV